MRYRESEGGSEKKNSTPIVLTYPKDLEINANLLRPGLKMDRNGKAKRSKGRLWTSELGTDPCSFGGRVTKQFFGPTPKKPLGLNPISQPINNVLSSCFRKCLKASPRIRHHTLLRVHLRN